MPVDKVKEAARKLRIYRTKEGRLSASYYHQRVLSRRRGHPAPSYTKEWFIEWALSQDAFHKQFELWEDNDYESDYSVSIDRIDTFAPYTEDNIQIMSWYENRMKENQVSKELRGKPIVLVDDDDNLISIYSCVREAQERLDINMSSVFHSLHGRAVEGGYSRYGNRIKYLDDFLVSKGLKLG